MTDERFEDWDGIRRYLDTPFQRHIGRIEVIRPLIAPIPATRPDCEAWLYVYRVYEPTHFMDPPPGYMVLDKELVSASVDWSKPVGAVYTWVRYDSSHLPELDTAIAWMQERMPDARVWGTRDRYPEYPIYGR